MYQIFTTGLIKSYDIYPTVPSLIYHLQTLRKINTELYISTNPQKKLPTLIKPLANTIQPIMNSKPSKNTILTNIF